jgi:hypothetical protein
MKQMALKISRQITPLSGSADNGTTGLNLSEKLHH